MAAKKEQIEAIVKGRQLAVDVSTEVLLVALANKLTGDTRVSDENAAPLVAYCMGLFGILTGGWETEEKPN